jgi:hypothetical protein
MLQSQIAAVIQRDLLRADDSKPSNPALECSSCGRGMTYKGRKREIVRRLATERRRQARSK